MNYKFLIIWCLSIFLLSALFFSAASFCGENGQNADYSLSGTSFLVSCLEEAPDPAWEGIWSGEVFLQDGSEETIVLSIIKTGEKWTIEYELSTETEQGWKWRLGHDALLGEMLFCPQQTPCQGKKSWILKRFSLTLTGNLIYGWLVDVKVLVPEEWDADMVTTLDIQSREEVEFDRMP